MKFLAIFLTLIISLSAAAATPYHTENVMLLQPDFVLQERVSSIAEFSEYVKAVQEAATRILTSESPTPTSGFLVLAVRPGAKSEVLLDFNPALPAPIAAKLRAALKAVPAFSAKNGVVVFALNSTLWGAPATQGFPNPPEWKSAIKGNSKSIEIGDLVDKIWTDEAGT